MNSQTSLYCINVDPTNPGQFFACCGLLELSDRKWGGAEGWFDSSLLDFHIRPLSGTGDAKELLQTLGEAGLRNTMTDVQLDRLQSLKDKGTKKLTNREKDEKKTLESLWRDSPLVLDASFHMRLDWFHDSRSGGSRFKTWAGQQSVIDIARSMKRPVENGLYENVPLEGWLQHSHGHDVTFNFDSDGSVQAAPLDVGFSLDPLGMSSASRPLLELLAFIGLQRFRPYADPKNNAYTYTLWTRPQLPVVASAVACGVVKQARTQAYMFPLLYRTKYLKSFLPAKPIGVFR